MKPQSHSDGKESPAGFSTAVPILCILAGMVLPLLYGSLWYSVPAVFGLMGLAGRRLSLRERVTRERGVPPRYAYYTIIEKQCGRCGGHVAATARPGNCCPLCGARWHVDHISE